MISEDSKKTIDALSEEELLFEKNLGRRSRFQREKFDYLKTRLELLERNKTKKIKSDRALKYTLFGVEILVTIPVGILIITSISAVTVWWNWEAIDARLNIQRDGLIAKIELSAIDDTTATYDITFINNGKRQVSILKIYGALSDNASFDDRENSEPLLSSINISPPKMITHRVVQPIDFGQTYPPVSKYYAGLVFHVIDFEGHIHSAVFPLLAIKYGDSCRARQIVFEDSPLTLLVGTDSEIVVSREVEILDNPPFELKTDKCPEQTNQ